MRSRVRFTFVALLIGAIVAVAAPAAAQAAAVEIEKFVGVNCKVTAEKCGEKVVGADIFGEPIAETVEPNVTESEEQGYTQAAGHVPFGVTDFTVKHTGSLATATAAPTGVVTHVRVDVAAGLATAPAAVPQCTMAEFGAAEAIPGTGFYAAPTCKEGLGLHGTGPESTVIGQETATVFVEPLAEKALPPDVTVSGKLYNLIQPTPPNARASLFGAALKLPIGLTKGILEGIFKKTKPEIENAQYYAHTLVEGNVEWGQQAKGTGAGDYHDYFEVNVSPNLPVIRSRQEDYGTTGDGSFITNATNCSGNPVNNTTYLTLEGVQAGSAEEVKARLESGKREVERRPYKTLKTLNGCGLVPFEPTFALTPATTLSDQPDGITATAGLTRHPSEEIDSAQLKQAAIKLPEGMTLNPSAAAGLTACTPAQARIHSEQAGTECPASSSLGTVSLTVPTLPASEPLTGNIYLGTPADGGKITGPPYIVYIDAEAPRYDVSVRLKSETIPNEATGQVTAIFNENPEQPFTSIAMHFKEGALAPIANPLTCATGTIEASFQPFTLTAAKTLTSSFASGGCANPIPFALTQSTANQTGSAGGNTSFTLSLTRPEGNQYVGAVKTTLPAGLIGQIPKATQCTDAQANANACPESSQIGTASAISGSGPTPYTFGNGKVYLTEKYAGAPFGLSIVVPAEAGPFNLGPVTTRAKLEVDPYTARVTTTAVLPTIVKGIPIRLRGVTVSINKQGFLLNPTNCQQMATETVATSTDGATQSLSSPFQVGNCSALKFKPTFKAKSSARTSKANGAELETTLNEVPGNANVKSVKVQLPKQLPSRLTTLQKACPAATFESNPFHCPAGSFVGGVRANTPTLAGKLKGPAILVSHAAAAFPDLDLVMEAEGVRSILVGNTDIKKGITTTTFASTPDVPVSSITVNLPIGPHSALAANGNLCASKLVMPTTMTGQNGTTTKQNTIIGVANCGVRVVGHKVVGNTAYVTVQTYAAGRISGKGSGLANTFRRLGKAQKAATLRIPLSRGGRARRKPFSVKVRVGFVPKARGQRSSVAFVTVRFR